MHYLEKESCIYVEVDRAYEIYREYYLSRGIWDGRQVCVVTAVSAELESHACAVSIGNCGTIDFLC